MFGKKKLAILLIVVFIVCFSLITMSYASDINFDTFANIENKNDSFINLLSINYLLIFIGQIPLTIVNIILLILSKKVITMEKRRDILIVSIALFFVLGCINLVVQSHGNGGAIITEEQIEAVRKADTRFYITTLVITVAILFSQILILTNIIKQKVKTKNDIKMQDV